MADNLEKDIRYLRDGVYKNPSEAWEKAGALYTIGVEKQDNRLKAIALNAVSAVGLRFSQDPSYLYPYVQQAVEYGSSAGDETEMFNSYHLLGIVDIRTNFWDRAMLDFLTSLEYGRRQKGSCWQLGALYANLATTARHLGDPGYAREYCRDAIHILEQYGNNQRAGHYLTDALATAGFLCLDGRNANASTHVVNLNRALSFRNRIEKLVKAQSTEEESSLYAYYLLTVEISHLSGNQAEEEKAHQNLIKTLLRYGIYDDNADNILDYLDYLIETEDIVHFGDILKISDKFEDHLDPGYEARWLDDCIQYESLMKKDAIRRTEVNAKKTDHDVTDYDRTAEDLALQYYKAVKARDKQRETLRKEAAELHRIGTLRHSMRRFREFAETDQLTKLPNRNRLKQEAAFIFEFAAREKTPVAVCMLDVDYFKQFNDMNKEGHEGGDRCLRMVSDAMKRLSERHHGVFAARWGGDEFVILYQRMGEAEVRQCATELGLFILGQKKKHPYTGKAVSISQGICFGTPGSIPDELDRAAGDWSGSKRGNRYAAFLAAADNALYHAKKNKGNGMGEIDPKGRICIHDEDTNSDEELSLNR